MFASQFDSLYLFVCLFFLTGESFLKSLFTFLLITKRVNPQKTSAYVEMKFKNLKSWII